MRGAESQKNLLTIENEGGLEKVNDYDNEQRSAATGGYQHQDSASSRVNTTGKHVPTDGPQNDDSEVLMDEHEKLLADEEADDVIFADELASVPSKEEAKMARTQN